MNNAKSRSLLLACVLTSSIAVSAFTAGCSANDEEAPASNEEAQTRERTTPPPTENTDGADASAPKPSQDSGTKAAAADAGSDSGAVACLDDKAPATQPACPTAGAGDECTGACDDYATNFKKGVSAEIRKCLTKALCEAGNTSTCTDKALAKACADATATTFCTPMVTGCKGANPQDTITQASCEGIAKGLTTAGRNALKTCFENEAVCGDCITKLK